MKLILENIGMLKNATITLNRLCIIAGENDNGKSTVGKVVFCLIKAINRYREDLNESKEHKIRDRQRDMFFLLRRNAESAFEAIEDTFRKLHDKLESLISDEDRDFQYSEVSLLVEELVTIAELDGEVAESFRSICRESFYIATAPEDERKSIESALNKVFASEFDSSVLLEGEVSGSIRLYENKRLLLSIKVSNGNKLTLDGDIEPIELTEATFIESPLILNNHDLLIRSQTGLTVGRSRLNRLGIPFTTLHTKDLFEKLKEPLLEFNEFSHNEADLTHKLREIMSGSISYDSTSRDFIYTKKNHTISIKNTASGIKVFGIIQLLIANDYLKKNTVIVFDEPENHLHPKWQLKLAEVLVAFAQAGVYIVVSSHSPYMLEALKRFSQAQGVEDQTNFYLAKENMIEDKDGLEEIFSILSEPFKVFESMDREMLRNE